MKKTPKLQLTPEQKLIAAELRRQAESVRSQILAEGRRVFAADAAMQVELRSVFALLKAVRKSQGVSLDSLSKLTGIGKPALSRMENDPAPNVQLTTLQRIATALGQELRISLASTPPIVAKRPRRQAAISVR